MGIENKPIVAIRTCRMDDVPQIRKLVINTMWSFYSSIYWEWAFTNPRCQVLLIFCGSFAPVYLEDDASFFQIFRTFLFAYTTACIAMAVVLLCFMKWSWMPFEYTELSNAKSFMSSFMDCGSDAHFWVAAVDKEVVASIGVKISSRPFLEKAAGPEVNVGQMFEIKRMFVKEKYRGTGLAQRLMQKAYAHTRQRLASDQSIIKKTILYTANYQYAALKFYQREGFEELTRYTTTYLFGVLRNTLWVALKDM